ncbi:MAG: DNA mismatch repair endonuclease MutL [Pirellulaceae bacterium]|nr:DNA mismatch repair endonuclease MutL [Pirellulaceae bacterium]
MPTIRQLPPSLVNKIAAGEVIERPASVVKELLENSIDAGATSVELSIEGGGMELIRLSDNGCGITADQVPLALASHATSKLQTADDLFDVHTLGFRGEALASIAEVSHLTIRTRTAETDAGCEVEVRGGQTGQAQPAGCPVGTTIEVRNLFFNTPVRRKFLKTPQTETNHILEAFTRIALAFPQVQMKLLTGARVTLDLPATDSWKQRIGEFFGDEIADNLIAVDNQQDEIQLAGYVADPAVSRSNNRMQYLFLNGRYIRDRSLQHALGEAYRGLLMTGRFPVCFLRLEMPAHLVDVNVHPTKMEVRFLEGGKLYSQLLQTLRHQFLTTDLTARARHVPGPLPLGLRDAAQSSGNSAQPSTVVIDHNDEARWQAHSQRMTSVAPAAGGLNLPTPVPPFRPFSQSASFPSGPTAAHHLPTGHTANDWTPASVPTESVFADGLPLAATKSRPDSSLPSGPLPDDFASSQAPPDIVNRDRPAEHAFESAAPPQPSHLGIQIHNRYLITQDDHGMVVVDQHALHERILYEQLRQRIDNSNLESQQLLMPEPVDLTPVEAAAAIEFREVLGKIGIQVEPFGGDTILLTSYPAMLANMRPAEVLRQVLEPLMSGGQQPCARDVLDELLHMLACKAAIKAGDRLTADEVTALLEQRYHYQDTHHCPHGRPTALFFSRQQLDKMFKRT